MMKDWTKQTHDRQYVCNHLGVMESRPFCKTCLDIPAITCCWRDLSKIFECTWEYTLQSSHPFFLILRTFLVIFFSALCLHQKAWKFTLLRKSQQMFLLFSSPSEELLLWMGCQRMYLVRTKYLASKSTKGRLWCASPLLSSSSCK